MSRYVVDPDYKNDCITVRDELDELKTNYDSDLILAPAEDGEIIVNQLNFQDMVIKRLSHELIYNGYDQENIDEIIADIKENPGEIIDNSDYAQDLIFGRL